MSDENFDEEKDLRCEIHVLEEVLKGIKEDIRKILERKVREKRKLKLHKIHQSRVDEKIQRLQGFENDFCEKIKEYEEQVILLGSDLRKLKC